MLSGIKREHMMQGVAQALGQGPTCPPSPNATLRLHGLGKGIYLMVGFSSGVGPPM